MQLSLQFAYAFVQLMCCALAAAPSTTDALPISTLLDIAGNNESIRSLQAALPLYCNITGACSKCSAAHLHTDACKHSGHAEKLLCITDSQPAHQVVLHLHRRINTSWQPLHISRSCPDPKSLKAAAGPATAPADSNATASISHDDWATGTAATSSAALTASKSVNGSDQQQQQSAAEAPGLVPATPSQIEEPLPGPALSGGRGWGLLHFELVMVLLLSGALPVVYLRKRRYVRL